MVNRLGSALSLRLLIWLLLAGECQTAFPQTPSPATGATLQEFVDAALAHNPQLGIAAETLKIRTARKDAVVGQLLPQLSASASLTENRQEALKKAEQFKGERYALQLTQVLFNWEAFAARRRARLAEVQQEAEYAHERSLLLTQVADLYLKVLQAQDALASVQAELAAVRMQAEQLQSLFDRQLARITDLRQAQASRSAVGAEQIKLQSELEMAREALQSISGLGIGDLGTLREDAAIPPLEQDINAWAQLVVANNPQVKAGRIAVEEAEQGISQATGALLPKLSLVAQRQESDVGFDNAPIRRTGSAYVGISGSMALYSGGSGTAAIREARSTRALVERQLRQLELDANAQVRQAYLQLQSGQSLVAAAADIAAATRLSVEAAQREFALGRATNVEVLKALRDRFQAERDLQKARYDDIRYFLALKHASGTLTQEDLSAVSAWFATTEP